jgi:hypothetical protein
MGCSSILAICKLEGGGRCFSEFASKESIPCAPGSQAGSLYCTRRRASDVLYLCEIQPLLYLCEIIRRHVSFWGFLAGRMFVRVRVPCSLGPDPAKSWPQIGQKYAHA